MSLDSGVMKIGRKIQRRMAELGIKSNQKLADIMNRDAKIVHPYTIGKWIAGKSNPRGDKLIALAKALNMSVELLVLEEGQNPKELKVLHQIVREIVRAEVKTLHGDRTATTQTEVLEFFNSPKIPTEDKQSILRQIRNVLQIYKEPQSSEEKTSESTTESED
jgi:transcriptional regulator with XRE-family HTH domain